VGVKNSGFDRLNHRRLSLSKPIRVYLCHSWLLFILFLITPVFLFSQNLTLSQKAGQVILAAIDGSKTLAPYMKNILEEASPGGILLFRYNLNASPAENAIYIEEISKVVANKAAGIRPFMAVDQEGGTVQRFVGGYARLPNASSYAASPAADPLAALQRDAAKAAKDMQAIGINLNLAPLGEVLRAENEPFLKERSYGPDTNFVYNACTRFINAMQANGIICVLKHFPDSGSGDPHKGEQHVPYSKAELTGIAAPMIKLLHNNEASAVMVSHAVIDRIDDTQAGSMSEKVITEWLQGEIGFNGLIIADDFSMAGALAGSAAAKDPNAAAIKALAAGVDMVICWPPDIKKLHKAIINAVHTGILPEERLDNAVSKIIKLKVNHE
jgi:beta-N-acetylhexosaminidase